MYVDGTVALLNLFVIYLIRGYLSTWQLDETYLSPVTYNILISYYAYIRTVVRSDGDVVLDLENYYSTTAVFVFFSMPREVPVISSATRPLVTVRPCNCCATRRFSVSLIKE